MCFRPMFTLFRQLFEKITTCLFLLCQYTMIHFMLYKASVRFPYWLFSHFPAQDFLCNIFQSCIFTSCIFVPHFPVSHFLALQFCAVFSIPAFSSPAFFLVPHFHVSHFQSHLFNVQVSSAYSWCVKLRILQPENTSTSSSFAFSVFFVNRLPRYRN